MQLSFSTKQSNQLYHLVYDLYQSNPERLLFHGWHHIFFVTKKAQIFAKAIQADLELVESAALVHDLNYVVKVNTEPEEAANLRTELLQQAGFNTSQIERIESIITESHTSTRTEVISTEGMALSDADTLFKALPTTQIYFTSKYIEENQVDLISLKNKILKEQIPLLNKGIYFYTDKAKEKYLDWATRNLEFWQSLDVALADEDVQEMLEIAKKDNII